jgi:IS30 family transposase
MSKLSLPELQRIYLLREKGLGIREISRKLNRSASTITRELKRNRPPLFWEWDCWSRARYSFEQRKHRRSFSRQRLRLKSASLRIKIINKLKDGVSPELISLRLKTEQNEEEIGYQAIYNWLYTDGREYIKYLVRKGKRGTRGGKRKPKAFQSEKKRSIHERTKNMDDRERFGDWEGDTIVSSKSKACVFTLRERKSRFILFTKMKDCTAFSAYNAVVQNLVEIPPEMRYSLTLDNGSENSCFERIEERLKLFTYFCDPYASWQRGAVENGNGFFRRDFPKGTDFAHISPEQIKHVQNKHNNRPMKCLNGHTPAEVFFSQLSKIEKLKTAC